MATQDRHIETESVMHMMTTERRRVSPSRCWRSPCQAGSVTTAQLQQALEAGVRSGWTSAFRLSS
jgi:hypothetical protein